MVSFLKLTTGDYLLQTDGVSKLIIGQTAIQPYTFGGVVEAVEITQQYSFGAEIVNQYTIPNTFGGKVVLQRLIPFTFGGDANNTFDKLFTFGGRAVIQKFLGYFFGGTIKQLATKAYTFGTTISITQTKDFNFGGTAILIGSVRVYAFGGTVVRFRILPESKIYLTDKSEKKIGI